MRLKFAANQPKWKTITINLVILTLILAPIGYSMILSFYDCYRINPTNPQRFK